MSDPWISAHTSPNVKLLQMPAAVRLVDNNPSFHLELLNTAGVGIRKPVGFGQQQKADCCPFRHTAELRRLAVRSAFGRYSRLGHKLENIGPLRDVGQNRVPLSSLRHVPDDYSFQQGRAALMIGPTIIGSAALPSLVPFCFLFFSLNALSRIGLSSRPKSAKFFDIYEQHLVL